jgi:hypothetical protein
MAENLFKWRSELDNEGDRKAIAYAVRNHGPTKKLSHYKNWHEAARAEELWLLCRRFVMAALLAASRTYPPALATVRKLAHDK